MVDFNLSATSPLGEYVREFDGAKIEVVQGYSIISIAIPAAGEKTSHKAVSSGLKADIPQPGQFTRFSPAKSSGDGMLMAMQPSQMFYMWENSGEDALEAVSKKLGDAVYVTDQSDSWVVLSLSGAHARKALERICPIDLHREKFLPGNLARTQMEHMGVVVMCMAADSYWLMSARSSSESFLHAVETSVSNVI